MSCLNCSRRISGPGNCQVPGRGRVFAGQERAISLRGLRAEALPTAANEQRIQGRILAVPSQLGDFARYNTVGKVHR